MRVRSASGSPSDPEGSNPFWGLFKNKLAQVGSPEANHGRVLDELFLVHSYITNIRELFEEHGILPNPYPS